MSVGILPLGVLTGTFDPAHPEAILQENHIQILNHTDGVTWLCSCAPDALNHLFGPHHERYSGVHEVHGVDVTFVAWVDAPGMATP